MGEVSLYSRTCLGSYDGAGGRWRFLIISEVPLYGRGGACPDLRSMDAQVVSVCSRTMPKLLWWC